MRQPDEAAGSRRRRRTHNAPRQYPSFDVATGSVLVGVAFLLGIGPYVLMWRYDSSLRPLIPPPRTTGGGGGGHASRPGVRGGGVSTWGGGTSGRAVASSSKGQEQQHDGNDSDSDRRRLVESRRRRDGYPRPDRTAAGPTPVYILPTHDGDDGRPPSRLLSFLNEGVDSSSRLVRAPSPEVDGVVWLVDLTRVMCDDLVDMAENTMRRRMELHREAVREGRPSPFGEPPTAGPVNDDVNSDEDNNISNSNGQRRMRRFRFTSALRWRVYILDFSDYGYVTEDDEYYGIDDLTQDCFRPLSDLLGRRGVFYGTRQHVLGRRVNATREGGRTDYEEEEEGKEEGEEEPFGPLGEIIDYGSMYLSHFMMGRVRHIDYGYRTLLDRHLREEAAELLSSSLHNATGRNGDGDGDVSALLAGDGDGGRQRQTQTVDLASLPRPYDVAHFWKVGGDDNRTGTVRDTVNDVIRSMMSTGGTDHRSGNGNDSNGDVGNGDGIRAYANHFGANLGTVRSSAVTRPLARHLLRYKIVVVAQQDAYEGHYRLMDALLSGALVMTDPVATSLPPYLEEGVSVVVYRSASELRRLVMWYLREENAAERVRIGRRGREVALRHHGPASWVERVVFGSWNTTLGV